MYSLQTMTWLAPTMLMFEPNLLGATAPRNHDHDSVYLHAGSIEDMVNEARRFHGAAEGYLSHPPEATYHLMVDLSVAEKQNPAEP
jgi:hypothetical protein